MNGKQRLERAWKAMASGDLALAQQEFQAVEQSAPSDPWLPLQKGLFLLRQDLFNDAASAFETFATVHPENPAPVFFLALAQELGGRHDQACDSLLRLRTLCPRHQGLASLELLFALRQNQALEPLQRFGFAGGAAAKESWRTLAAGIGLGDPAWLPPDLSSSPYLLGPILVEIERRLLAREIPTLEYRDVDLLEQLDGLQPPVRRLREELRQLPRSWRGSARLKKGQRVLNQAMGQSDLAEQKAQLEQAIVLLEQARELDPLAFRVNYHLGEAYLFSAKTPPGTPYLREALLQAEAAFVESVRIDGSNPYVLYYLAFVSHVLGRPYSALAAYQRATEKFTKLPEAHYGMGQCQLLLGQEQPARELFLRAVNSDLALGRERLALFAELLQREGPEAFSAPLPKLPPVVTTPVAESDPEAPWITEPSVTEPPAQQS